MPTGMLSDAKRLINLYTMKKNLRWPAGFPPVQFSPGRTAAIKGIRGALSLILLLLCSFAAIAQTTISGTVLDDQGVALPGVSVKLKGTTTGTLTDSRGHFTMKIPSASGALVFSYIGYLAQEVALNGQPTMTVSLKSKNSSLTEVVVTGYGSQKKQSITGAISSITSKDIDRVHGGSTVSSTLAGKIPGVTFRQAEGRPGAAASIQIRNMGTPLYIIDGIQRDESEFNNIAPNDVSSVTVLKDASAAIYGVRAANGVVVVTTKRGRPGDNTVNVDAYLGFQNWTRFPEVLNSSYDYEKYLAEAQVNQGGTSITPDILAKYKNAAGGPAYRSFDWKKFVLSNKNAPLNSVNVNFQGGTDKVTYYLSATNLFQNSPNGAQYKFNRFNVQSNVQAQISKRLRVGMNINGRVESHENPGVPGADDYFLAKFAILRNTPLERPYANDNPLYLNDIGHTESNYAFLNEALSGKFRSDKRVAQTIFNAEYQIPGIKGLTAKALYSYEFSDYLVNNQEFTYNAYTYRPGTNAYDVTGGSTNPWREREQIKDINITSQLQLNYENTFGKSTIGATLVNERIALQHTRNWLHASPISNNLPLIYFPTTDTYQDSAAQEARIGYIARVNYNFDNKYYVEGSARRDASYLFAPDKRIGYFPGVSVGWRITQERFMKQLLGNSTVLSDLKFRGSYGILGDDRSLRPNYNNNPIVAPTLQPIVLPYAYLPGYNYNQGTAILDGLPVTTSRDKGVPVTRISWLRSKITDVGADFSLFGGKVNGSVDYFKRVRTGLLANPNQVVVPREIGYNLPQENLNSDQQQGGEFALGYTTKFGAVNFSVGGNASYSRYKTLNTARTPFLNSLDQYRNSNQNRFGSIDWGYEVVGQFKSQAQINSYKVNIDGKGNSTLLPGDLIYKDQNGDGKIDQNDERPIGYGQRNQPNINFGFNFALGYKGFDFHADFSGAAGYTWFQDYETKWPFQNNGNLNTIFLDRWHHTDPYDVNSAWIPGKYPALRNNPGNNYSDYSVNGQTNSSFWAHNVKYIRARTIELGYSLPKSLLERTKILKAARFYINGYNLFSIDNVHQYHIDPEIADGSGLQTPQSKVVNIGANLSF